MVAIKKKIRGQKTYYYLQQSYRVGDKVKTKEIYIGTKVPGDIKEIRRALLASIRKERWYGLFDNIKKKFAEDRRGSGALAIEKEREYFTVKFTYNTNRIEGSSLTYIETAMLLTENRAPDGKPMRDVREAESHRDVFLEMLREKQDLSLKLILKWHKELFEDTKPELAGKIRAGQVWITGSVFVPPPAGRVIPSLKAFFKWYNKEKRKLHPVELAALVHLKFVGIHPFGDGNGRVSRLMMNFILHKNGYPMVVVPYDGRKEYYLALEKAQTSEDEKPFIDWFFKNYRKENEPYRS